MMDDLENGSSERTYKVVGRGFKMPKFSDIILPEKYYKYHVGSFLSNFHLKNNIT